MTRSAVTPDLLHHLVTSSHAETITRFAVAAVIEHDHRVLLIEHAGDELACSWEPPTDLAMPGETLTDAVHRIAAQAGIDIDHITSYLGHHDVLTEDGDDIVRLFGFAATTADPDRICRLALTAHLWAAVDDLPDSIDRHVLRFLGAAPAAVTTDEQDPAGPLPAALRAHARGLLAAEAAIDLLIATCWLARSDFVDAYVDPVTAPSSSTAMASVDWPGAITALDTGPLASSGGEARMLRIAASLADGIPVDLRDALTGLDTDNRSLVSQAIHHASGRPPQPLGANLSAAAAPSAGHFNDHQNA